MDLVITHNKTYQERLSEFTSVLSGYKVLSVSQVRKEWSYYLELTLDPNGWQAIWKIPRLQCEELKIAFPTLVLVYVENVDYVEMGATVRILAVQDDIHLLKKHYANLVHLWPTKEQDRSICLNLSATANSLDMLRFFYTNIFMPWDMEEEDTEDWLSKHLEPRLRLYYDIRNRTIPGPTAEHLKGLLTEARRLHTCRQQLETKIAEGEEEEECESPLVQNLSKVVIRIMQIRNEIELLENPLLRNTLLQSQQQVKPREANVQPINWCVFGHGKVEEMTMFLDQLKTHLSDDENVRCRRTLALVLENANASDRIFLNKARHMFRALGPLQEGGVLKGLYMKGDTIIATTNEGVMLDCCGDLLLENLTIDADVAQCGILVRCGTVTLRNCKIIGDGKSSTHQGIIVLAGGKLNMMDCDINGFFTAIVGNSNSEISVKNCEIFQANLGLHVHEGCKVTAETSRFHNCQDYGICVESNVLTNSSQVGDFSILEVVPGVSIDNLSGENNGKGDAIVNHKSRFGPIHDLFSNPELDPTVVHNNDDESVSDEEMDVNTSSENSFDKTMVKVYDLNEVNGH